MPYTEFDLPAVETKFGLRLRPEALFPNLVPAAVPVWLTEHLTRTRDLALLTEKARSELLIMPVLLAVRELSGKALAIFSGQRLDVDASRGLSGECDFLLSKQDAVPVVRAPLMAVVEAKRGDIEAGLGQCLAQMVAARLFNEKAGHPQRVFGCVTTGEDWQFLRLTDTDAVLDTTRRYVSDLSQLLGAFMHLGTDPG